MKYFFISALPELGGSSHANRSPLVYRAIPKRGSGAKSVIPSSKAVHLPEPIAAATTGNANLPRTSLLLANYHVLDLVIGRLRNADLIGHDIVFSLERTRL